jgi:hypothetical protein
VPLVDKDDMVSTWHAAQAARELPAEVTPPPRAPAPRSRAAVQAPARRRWWRRRQS